MSLSVVRMAVIFTALALLGALPAQAQPTIRLEPDPAVFPSSQTYSTLSVSIFVDDIPAPGLRSFIITIKARPRGEDGPPCVKLHPAESGTIDSDLEAAWERHFDSVQPLDDFTAVQWFARGLRNAVPTGGSLRLGSLKFRVQMGKLPTGCFGGMQDNFRWDRKATQWGSGGSPTTPFSRYLDSPWALVRLPSVDLSVACARSSSGDPNFFVDGDVLTLSCDVSNTGTSATQVIPLVGAFFSTDAVLDPGDVEFVRSSESGTVGGQSSAALVMSAQPIQTTPQTLQICTKVDLDPNFLDNERGVIFEADETNNTECSPITVLRPHRDLVPVPGSATVSPDPTDPNGVIRAGLALKISYDVLNQGNAAVRETHRNQVYIGSSLAAARADPNARLCGVTTTGAGILPLAGGGILRQSFGLGTGSSKEVCKIPFRFPLGSTSLFVELDSTKIVEEQDPNFDPAPAEGNNVLEMPITVGKPLDPQFRVQHSLGFPNDHDVELFGPGTGTMLITAASVREMTAYSLRLQWGPSDLITIGDPNVPGGDPGGVEFLDFLEQGGLVQSCSVDAIDTVAGTLDISCTTSDPNGNGRAAVSERPAALARLTWTTLLPGVGAFTLVDFAAQDGSGQPFRNVRKIDGRFVVSGVPDLSVVNPVSPPEAYPGLPFSASWDVFNNGFGTKKPPLITELIISRDSVQQSDDPNSPDVRACFVNESVPLPGKSGVSRTASPCLIPVNLRPGNYTGFYQLQLGLDPNKGETDIIPLPSRLVSLVRSSRGTMADTYRAPSQPGDSVKDRLARGRRFSALSMASVRSVDRNRNWLVGLAPSGGTWWRVTMYDIPLEESRPMELLREVRVPREDKRILGAADIDGDGDDEIIILQEDSSGERLGFRRIDFSKLFPLVCQTAARTGPLGEGILGATGIQFDADPEDELAVVTGDGALTIHDIALTGSLPPARPCDTIPVVLLEPATADLMPLASDTGFSSPGNKVRALCTMDDALDGTEEITALFDTLGGQAVRVFQVPAGPGGTAVVVADYPSFGGIVRGAAALGLSGQQSRTSGPSRRRTRPFDLSGRRPMALDLSCTR